MRMVTRTRTIMSWRATVIFLPVQLMLSLMFVRSIMVSGKGARSAFELKGIEPLSTSGGAAILAQRALELGA